MKPQNPKRYRVVGQVMSDSDIAKLRDETPIEALCLNEDINSIRQSISLLKRVDSTNITRSDSEVDRDFGYNMQQLVLAQLKTWERYAQLKLRKRYLAP